MRTMLYLAVTISVLSHLQRTRAIPAAPAPGPSSLAALAPAAAVGNATTKKALYPTGLGALNLGYLTPAQSFIITPVNDNSSCFSYERCAGGAWSEQANVTYGDNPQHPIHVCICQNALFTMQTLVQEYSSVSG